ncbi:hypothetical protein GGU11DRAFT_812738 [Lentinula aff. detonsa]|nr:hypothetical protein GGU11DRAFT_812738 [Lentinula aff. detonsa]
MVRTRHPQSRCNCYANVDPFVQSSGQGAAGQFRSLRRAVGVLSASQFFSSYYHLHPIFNAFFFILIPLSSLSSSWTFFGTSEGKASGRTQEKMDLITEVSRWRRDLQEEKG